MSMSRQEAIEFLLDYYQNPRNRGALEDADVHLSGGNPGCADRVEMYAKVGPDGRVEDVTFEGEGYDAGRGRRPQLRDLDRRSWPRGRDGAAHLRDGRPGNAEEGPARAAP